MPHLPLATSPPWTPGLADPSAAERVRAWWARAEGVTPVATLRAWRADWAIFLTFCREQGSSPLPAQAETVAAFVEARRHAGRKPATVRRQLSTIGLAHRVAKLASPCTEEAVQLAVRGLVQERGARQRQARALGWAEMRIPAKMTAASG